MLGPNLATLPNMMFDYPVSQLQGGYLEKNGPDWAIRPAQTYHNISIVHVDYSACRGLVPTPEVGTEVLTWFQCSSSR